MPGIGLGLTARRGGLSPAIAASLPSLDLDFLQQRYQMSLVQKAFGDIITFTRASSATRINALGVIESVASNVPRIDHSPLNLASGTGTQTLSLPKDRTYALTVVGGGTATVTGGVVNGLLAAATGVIKTVAGSGNADVTFTVSGTVTALHVREVLGLLVEEQRTNLVLNSDDIGQASWFKSGATVSGKKLVESSANEAHRVLSNAGISLSVGSVCMTTVVKPSGRNHAYFRLNGASGDVYSGNVRLSDAVVTQTHSGSISAVLLSSGEVKVTCSGSVTVAGNHWPEVRVSNSDTYANYSGDGVSGIEILWSQLEQGSFPTSYIPTSGSQVTRAADVCSINTLSPWYNQSEGSVFIEASMFAKGTSAKIVSIDDNTWNNCMFIDANVATGRFMVISGGSLQANIALSSDITVGFAHKFSAVYGGNDFRFLRDAGAISYDTSGVPPSVTSLSFSDVGRGSGFTNGHIRKLKYFPSA